MCYSLWYNAPTMLPATGRQHRAPEDGRDQRPKHVELIVIINKPLLLHLVGCLYHLYSTMHGKINIKFTLMQLVCIRHVQ